MSSVAVEAQGLAEADEEGGEGPGESCVVVPADENEEKHESLDDGEIGFGKEFGPRQGLFHGEAVFLNEGGLLGTEIEFDLRVLGEASSIVWGTCTYLLLVQRGDRGIIDGEHQRLRRGRETIQVVSELLDHLAHAGDVDDLEYGVDILLVDLPDEGDLGREGMEGSEVDVG